MEKGIQVQGEPKTVTFSVAYKGVVHEAPMECWLSAMIVILSDEQKAKLFDQVGKMIVLRERQKEQARIVAGIKMPSIG